MTTTRILPGITETELLAALPGTAPEIEDRLRAATTDPERFLWAHVNPNVVNAVLAAHAKRLGIRARTVEVPYGRGTAKRAYWYRKEA